MYMTDNSEKVTKLRLLILDGDGRQVLPFLSSLKRAGHHVTVACYRRLSPGYLSRYPNRRVVLPVCEEEPKRFKEAVLKLISTGKYDIVCPLGHYTTRFCVEHRKQLEKYASVPVPDYEVFMRAYDKGQTMAFCMKNNIPCPMTYFPDEEGIDSIINRASFPLFLKPRIGVGAIGQRQLETPQDIRTYYPLFRKKYGPMIIQEYIPHDTELICHTFWDSRGKMCACMVNAKPRFFPLRGGTNTVLVSIDRPDVVEYCKRLFEGIGMVGIADADFLVDPRDGRAKVMEVNPRVSCGIKIGFVSGIDYADMLLRLAKGLPIEPKLEYKKNLCLRNLCQEILWYMFSSRQARRTTKPSFWKFFGKNVFYQTISLDDPLTFIGFVLNMLCKYSPTHARAEKLGN